MGSEKDPDENSQKPVPVSQVQQSSSPKYSGSSLHSFTNLKTRETNLSPEFLEDRVLEPFPQSPSTPARGREMDTPSMAGGWGWL